VEVVAEADDPDGRGVPQRAIRLGSTQSSAHLPRPTVRASSPRLMLVVAETWKLQSGRSYARSRGGVEATLA
jgi:hypothetical protein